MTEEQGQEDVTADVIQLDGGTVDRVEAEVVHIQQGGANRIVATDVEMRLGGAVAIDAESVAAHQAAVVMLRGDQAALDQSYVGGVVAQELTLVDSASAVAVAGTADFENSRVGILLAREVRGEVETLLDARGALLAGVAAGAVLGLILALGSLFSRRRS